VIYTHLNRRQTNATPSPVTDSDTLQSIAQSGISTLTCSGIGGIAATALGLRNNPILKNMMRMNPDSPPLDESTLAALPKDPIKVTSEGNTFFINIKDGKFMVNGLDFLPFGIMTGLHSKFGSQVYFGHTDLGIDLISGQSFSPPSPFSLSCRSIW
jgi:hypothetical protein